MFNCPKCSVSLGHCPNFCDFCGEKIPDQLIYQQRIREDVALAKFQELGGPVNLVTRCNPIEPCNAFVHWSKAYAEKQISKTAHELFDTAIRFCGNCGEELPDLSSMDEAEIVEKLQFFSNESELDNRDPFLE